MKKNTTKDSRQKKIDAALDRWLDEVDLSNHIAKGKVIKGRRSRPSKITITMPADLIEELKEAAEKRSIGYQTMIRLIVKENIRKYA